MYHRLALHVHRHCGRQVAIFSVSCNYLRSAPAPFVTVFRFPVDTAAYHVLAGILILVGIVRAYFGDALKSVGVFIDGFVFGFLLTFYIIYTTDAGVSEGMLRSDFVQ